MMMNINDDSDDHNEYVYSTSLDMPLGSTWTEPFGTRKNYYKWVERMTEDLEQTYGMIVSIEYDYFIDKE